MSIFRMDDNTVTVSCICGKDNVLKVSDLEIVGRGISFPCDTDGCNGIGGMLQGGFIFKKKIKNDLSVLLQTLGKRLFKLEKVSVDFPFDKVCLSRGEDWKEGSEVLIERIDYKQIPVAEQTE